MAYIYNVVIWLYKVSIIIASLFNKKARLWIKGRKNIFEKLKSEINKKDKIAWFHCASLGEFEQGRPVIEKFHTEYQDYKILLTFFSPSGYEIRKNFELVDFVFYLPIDTIGNARKFVDIVNPHIVLFVKYEFWFNYLNILYQRKIPVIVFSAIFRKNQHFFKWYGQWFRNALRKINFITVQNQESLDLLINIGLKNVLLSGDTRFDRVFQISENTQQLPLFDIFKQKSLVIIAGSTWRADEELICRFINENEGRCKYIIAPHIVSDENIAYLQNKIKTSTLKYSELSNENIHSSNVIIVDGIGYLSHLYAYADIAYIGGGFGKGIHNTLEAATFGLPIIFGPNYNKFQEAKDLVNKEVAFPINSYTNLYQKIGNLLENKQLMADCHISTKKFVNDHRGATKIIFLKIRDYLKSESIGFLL